MFQQNIKVLWEIGIRWSHGATRRRWYNYRWMHILRMVHCARILQAFPWWISVRWDTKLVVLGSRNTAVGAWQKPTPPEDTIAVRHGAAITETRQTLAAKSSYKRSGGYAHGIFDDTTTLNDLTKITNGQLSWQDDSRVARALLPITSFLPDDLTDIDLNIIRRRRGIHMILL